VLGALANDLAPFMELGDRGCLSFTGPGKTLHASKGVDDFSAKALVDLGFYQLNGGSQVLSSM
jgi:hypothetical protein